jgi:hypothetical protein
MREALLIIGGYGCANYTRGHCEHAGRIRAADFTADAWCDACIANAALGRARGRESHYAGPCSCTVGWVSHNKQRRFRRLLAGLGDTQHDH